MPYTIEQARAAGWGDRAEAMAEFMEEVDKHLRNLSSLEHEDLPDWDYAVAFEAGESPYRVAVQVLEENGFDLDAIDED